MSLETTRRGFLGATAGIAGLAASAASAAVDNESAGFKLGVATYSLREFQRALAIKMIKADPNSLRQHQGVPSAHRRPARRMGEGPQGLRKGRAQDHERRQRQLRRSTMSTTSRCEFEYAKTAGMPMMVCAPTHANLSKIEKFVKEYNISIAIHNHGPEDKHFPTPAVGARRR